MVSVWMTLCSVNHGNTEAVTTRTYWETGCILGGRSLNQFREAVLAAVESRRSSGSTCYQVLLYLPARPGDTVFSAYLLQVSGEVFIMN